MANDASELFVGLDGNIYVAPVGTSAPSALSAPSASWSLLGYLTEDGVTVTPGLTAQEIRSWQSQYPTRQYAQQRSLEVAFMAQQWEQQAIAAAFGGGTFNTAGGVTTYTPPDASDVYERAVLIDVLDGDDTIRWLIPRAINIELGEVVYNRQGEAHLPIKFGIMVPSSGNIWEIRSDKASFAVT